MALTPTEEAQTRQLIAQEAPLLSLASNEPTITSKLGATKVNLSQLPAASSLVDADIMLVRQGTTDKSVPVSILKTVASAGAVQKTGDTMTGPLIGVGATSGAQVPNFSQVISSLGGSPAMFGNVGATTTNSVTFTDEQVIVGTAINGTRWALPTFSQTLNTSGIGAGGMDTGSPPASGFVAIYAGLNTTSGARTVFGQTVTAAPTATYSGANAPSGYNATALIGILPTTAGGGFTAYAALVGRSVSLPSITVLTGGGPSAPFTAIALNAVAPFGAKAASGSMAITVNSLTSTTANIATNVGGSGAQNCAVPVTGAPMVVPFRCVITTARTIYYSTGSSVSNLNVIMTGYEF